MTPATVLVTGAGTGFGRLTAETLARQGHTVFATMRDPGGRNAEHAAALAALAAAEGLDLRVEELDVAGEDAVAAGVARVHAAAGRLDVVVNNVGTGSWGLAEAYTLDQVQQILDSNLLTAVRVDRAVLPHLRAQRSGLIVQVSSGVGRFVMPFMTLYSAAKHAVDAFAEGLHYELAPLGVESVIVEPGSFPTPGSLTGLIRPADAGRVAGYGALDARGQAMYAANDEHNRGPDAPDPQLVADAIAGLVALAPGTRPLRTTVGPPPAPQAGQINAVAEQVQAQTLRYMGLGDMLTVATPPSPG